MYLTLELKFAELLAFKLTFANSAYPSYTYNMSEWACLWVQGQSYCNYAFLVIFMNCH